MESDYEDKMEVDKGKKQANWIERLMELKKNWKEKEAKDDEYAYGDRVGYDEEEGCDVDYEDDEEEKEINIDREIFSSLLKHVFWSDTKLFSQLAFLCNMAYVIPDIKTGDLKRYYGLDFVTSSLEKKAEAAAIKDKVEKDSVRVPVSYTEVPNPILEPAEISEPKPRLSRPTAAYEIAASAASYVQSRAKDLISLGSEPQLLEDPFLENGHYGSYSPRIYKSEMAARVAASTMTAVVAAGEKQREEAAKDLLGVGTERSLHSSPCEWFVCDDSSIYTLYFVIQGSDSLASWQANLFFEPTKFEGTDVLVHRGIYEAAKGIYDQFMPDIQQHMNKFGDRAKLQFTGHSLGGSLALLVNLMLLTRKEVKQSAILPVVTFGSPYIFCGGQKILDQLGLNEKHVHCVMMHRDIVPRAFSCNYPSYVAQVLKRLNSTFLHHPCLNKNKLLYTPIGKIFILQPDVKSSPRHPLLPPGSALYTLDNTAGSLTKRAVRTFLNSPHPIETLSDPTAYGSEGTIIRDHDSSHYLKALNEVIRQHTRLVVRKAKKERNQLWPLLASRSPHSWSHTCNLKVRVELSNKILTGV
ncbi:hypothetical protein ACJIZ3_016390 [Penstemon smallii]|uniref:Fungal lipase-type domain-containing protein n=1 Tax=Penstemon smallii TaxID=265156 RepID=A0ABD3RSN0_9LAMI